MHDLELCKILSSVLIEFWCKIGHSRELMTATVAVALNSSCILFHPVLKHPRLPLGSCFAEELTCNMCEIKGLL